MLKYNTTRQEKRTVSCRVYSKNLCGRKMGDSWDFFVTMSETGTLFHTIIYPFSENDLP